MVYFFQYKAFSNYVIELNNITACLSTCCVETILSFLLPQNLHNLSQMYSSLFSFSKEYFSNTFMQRTERCKNKISHLHACKSAPGKAKYENTPFLRSYAINKNMISFLFFFYFQHEGNIV